MASTPLLVFGVLAGIAASMIPPCLPQLGPEFCPSTAAAAAVVPKWPPASVAYPDQMHQEKVLQDLVFPRIVKERMYNTTKFMTSPVPLREDPDQNRFPNRCFNASFGTTALRTLGIRAGLAVYDAFDQVKNSTEVVTFRYILNKTPQQSFMTKFLPEGNWNRSHDVIVIGAHFDSINEKAYLNGSSPEDMIAPGADDNASGFSVLLETLQVLGYLFALKRPVNEVQFHF